MNAVAMNIGYCSAHAIWHLRQRFQATGHMEDWPHQYINHVIWVHIHQRWLRQQWNSFLFSDESSLPFIKVMARFKFTIGEMNCMPTVAYLNEIVLRMGVLSWSGWALHMIFTLILSLLEGFCMSNATEMLSLCFRIMPLSLFYSLIMPQAIQLGRITFHLLMNCLPKALIWIPLCYEPGVTWK